LRVLVSLFLLIWFLAWSKFCWIRAGLSYLLWAFCGFLLLSNITNISKIDVKWWRNEKSFTLDLILFLLLNLDWTGSFVPQLCWSSLVH
jgi:hypothetical protein